MSLLLTLWSSSSEFEYILFSSTTRSIIKSGTIVSANEGVSKGATIGKGIGGGEGHDAYLHEASTIWSTWDCGL